MMPAQPNLDTSRPFPFQEMEELERAIEGLEQLLPTLRGRHQILTSELDRRTQPEIILIKPSKWVGASFEYLGRVTGCFTYIDIHCKILRELWTDFPDRREAMAAAMGHHGTTRAYVAKTRNELFPGHSIGWATRYSRKLVEGWYLDTNLGRERMQIILQAAVRAAGLVWGQDMKIQW